jgi:uncharacterized protein (DUF2267 family)
MPSANPDAFNHALHTANIWLSDINSAFGTRDRRYAQRTLRTWLHTLRDRLTIDAAVKFGQQLPELLRGIYYDGWEPNKVPIKYHADQYRQRFAAGAFIPLAQVASTAATITDVVANHMSPGQVDETVAALPSDLRAIIGDGTSAAPAAGPTTPKRKQGEALEDRVVALTDAVRTLAHGLENGQLTGSGIDQAQVARAARLADEILIAAGSYPRPQRDLPTVSRAAG